MIKDNLTINDKPNTKLVRFFGTPCRKHTHVPTHAPTNTNLHLSRKPYSNITIIVVIINPGYLYVLLLDWTVYLVINNINHSAILGNLLVRAADFERVNIVDVLIEMLRIW